MTKIFSSLISFRSLLAWACLAVSGMASAGIPGDWKAVSRTVGLDPDAPANSLTNAEKSKGWQLLFDGRDLSTWTGFKKPLGTDWKIENGTLAGNGAGGGIMTRENYGDFVWSAEWKIPPGGNSGMFFKVLEQGDESWWTGLEMQIYDNATGPGGIAPILSAGSLYDMYPPTENGDPAAGYRDATMTDSLGKPSGFNHALIVVQGKHVEGWLNGVRVLRFEIGTADWDGRRIASNYYRSHPEHGQSAVGHLLLQSHGSNVWYRNIKIRPLVSGQPGPYGPYIVTTLSTLPADHFGASRASHSLGRRFVFDALGVMRDLDPLSSGSLPPRYFIPHAGPYSARLP